MEIRKKTYGVTFPFDDSTNGDFLMLTETPEAEIKSNLIHLLLTRKGSRYFLPEFGTNIYQYIFEPLSDELAKKIENEIVDACEKFLPNLRIDSVNIERFDDNIEYVKDLNKQRSFKVGIDYTITSRTFQSRDNVIIIL